MIISFFLFGIELLVKSCVEKDDFKYSFFFWLDFVATLSLIPDIPWMTDLLNMLLGVKLSRYAVDVLPGSPQQTDNASVLAKLLKSARLIRLIRIIKLYNYAVKTNAEADEAKIKEQARASATKAISNLKKELDPTKLGKHLSDQLTRNLIMGILLLLMILPILSYSGSNYATRAGLREIFWWGSSSCTLGEGVKNW